MFMCAWLIISLAHSASALEDTAELSCALQAAYMDENDGDGKPFIYRTFHLDRTS
jgi:hypothetical protein